MSDRTFVTADDTSVFVRELDRRYPLISRGEGVWLYDSGGNAYLDGVSGGAMVTSLGHGAVPEILKAVVEQTQDISFLYNVHATTPAQETLARELIDVAPDGFTRAHFVSGGTEANELALRMVRSYHVERGQQARHLVVSPAQAYHGASIATFGLTGRAGLQAPYQPYIQQQPHIPPSTWLFDTSGEAALRALDDVLAQVGDQVAAFLIEPVSAASLPGYSPPEAFWRGLEERRREHGFLVWFDEVVTGLGRTGTWFAADQMPLHVRHHHHGKRFGRRLLPRRCDARAPACVSGSRRRIAVLRAGAYMGWGAAVVCCRFGGVGPSEKDGTRRCRP